MPMEPMPDRLQPATVSVSLCLLVGCCAVLIWWDVMRCAVRCATWLQLVRSLLDDGSEVLPCLLVRCDALLVE